MAQTFPSRASQPRLHPSVFPKPDWAVAGACPQQAGALHNQKK